MIVTISGIDGSGKTSLASTLTQRLVERGLPARMARPEYLANDTVKDFCEIEYGDRFAYFRHVDADFYIACLTADWLRFRATTLRSHSGSLLVCDRYVHDVLAQAIHMNAEARELRKQLAGFPGAELSFFLTIDPALAHARLLKRERQPIHEAEGADELLLLANAYNRVARETGWTPTVFDATMEMSKLIGRLEQLVINRWNEDLIDHA